MLKFGGKRAQRALLAFGLLTSVLMAAAQPSETLPLLRLERVRPLGLDLYMPVPEDNPLTTEKVALGRRLFFDPILSRDYSLSCATCHDPRRMFTDGLPVAVGVDYRKGKRNTPSLLNRAWGKSFSWNGRSTSLEEQVLMPIENPDEFDMTRGSVLTRLQEHSDYPILFESVFGRSIEVEDLGRAIASYVRTILSGNAPVDRYLNGDHEALSEQARDGLRLIRGKANCTACHIGPTFTDEQFHNTGVAFKNEKLNDEGRFAVTVNEKDRGAFKTPSLRNVADTAPYMHDGSLTTLQDVIDFYNRGGNPNSRLDEELHPLNLTSEEKQAVVSFLRALNGRIQEGFRR